MMKNIQLPHIRLNTEFPAKAFNDKVSSEKTLSCEPTVSSLNDEVDFRVSFDDSDDEDYTEPYGVSLGLGCSVLILDLAETMICPKGAADLVRIASLAICSWESLVEEGVMFTHGVEGMQGNGVLWEVNEVTEVGYGGLAGNNEEDIQ
ncbi:hypothetical protein Tco_0435554 [Tanacetum coccineum]